MSTSIDNCSLMKVSEVLRHRLEMRARNMYVFMFGIKAHALFIYTGRTYPHAIYIYAVDEMGRMASIKFDEADNDNLPLENVVARLLDCSKNHDICIGIGALGHAIKILDAGETLESLLIEHDLLAV